MSKCKRRGGEGGGGGEAREGRRSKAQRRRGCARAEAQGASSAGKNASCAKPGWGKMRRDRGGAVEPEVPPQREARERQGLLRAVLIRFQRMLFDRNGFVTFPEFLSPAGLSFLRRQVDEIYRDKVSPLLPSSRSSSCSTRTWTASGSSTCISVFLPRVTGCGSLRHMPRVSEHETSPAPLLTSSPAVVEMLQSYLGKEVQLYASQVRAYSPLLCFPATPRLLHRKVCAGANGSGGHAVPMHQDGDENVARASRVPSDSCATGSHLVDSAG
eukprot:750652-Hanusia_phi.AAC.1